MNILTQRPEDEEDPLAPIKAPDLLPAPSVAAAQILQGDKDNAGSGGSAQSTPALVSPQGFALPEKSVRSNWNSATRETKSQEMSPESGMLLADISRTNADTLDAQVKKEAADKEILEVEARKAEKAAINARLLESEKVLARQRHEDAVKLKLDPHIQARQEEHAKNSKITTYWEDRGVPAKIFAALMIGLNGFARSGRGMGGGNTALDIYNRAEDQDRQTKIDRFERSKEFLSLAKTDKVAAEEAHKNFLLKLEDLSITRGKRLADDSEALLSKLKIPQAAAVAAGLRAETERKGAESELKQRQIYERGITEGAPTTSGGTITNTSPGNDAQGPRQVRFLNGAPAGTVRDKETEKRITEKWEATHALRRDGMELDKFIKQHGGKPMDPALRRDLNNKVQAFVGHITKQRGTLTLQAPEWERYESTFTPGYVESLLGKKSNAIRDVITSAGRDYNNVLKGQGISSAPSAPAASEPPKAHAPTQPARPDKKTLVERGDVLRKFLNSDEAQKNPEKAKRARAALRAMGGMRE